jgi:hypothetical protein
MEYEMLWPMCNNLVSGRATRLFNMCRILGAFGGSLDVSNSAFPTLCAMCGTDVCIVLFSEDFISGADSRGLV